MPSTRVFEMRAKRFTTPFKGILKVFVKVFRRLLQGILKAFKGPAKGL